MTNIKNQELGETDYVSPKWHGLVSWLMACLFASLTLGLVVFVLSAVDGQNAFGTTNLAAVLVWPVLTLIAMLIIALPSLASVFAIRTLNWRRGWSDAIAGAIVGGAVPGLIIALEGVSTDRTVFAGSAAVLGGASGFVYWLCTRWLFRRGERRWLQSMIDQF